MSTVSGTSLAPALALGLDADLAWSALAPVMDPEIPVVSIIELGIVREVEVDGAAVRVTVTPTYSGCPATEMINEQIETALLGAGFAKASVCISLAPAWTTDWITPEAREKLRAYGIVPPGMANGVSAVQPIRFRPKALSCPRCGSSDTEQLSAFGSTACKALHRCLACREPFEYFNPL